MTTPLTLQQRLMIFFAQNPEMTLTGPEVCRKFGVAPNSIWSQLRRAVETDIFRRGRGVALGPHGAPVSVSIYSPGPVLLDELGYDPEEIAWKAAKSLT